MIVHIFYAGPQRKIHDRTGKLWHFEMHPYCGPATTTLKGDIRDTQPPQSSPFWEAVSAWAQQGEKSVKGLCIWTRPIEEKWVNIGAGNYAHEGSALALKYGRSQI